MNAIAINQKKKVYREEHEMANATLEMYSASADQPPRLLPSRPQCI